MPTKLLGERIKRKEDPALIQGRGHYVDDFKLNGLLHMVFVRSPHAHARVKSIKTDKARAMPGVREVLAGSDIQGKLGLVPCAVAMEGLKVPDHPCLALGEVRYVGEPDAIHSTRPARSKDRQAEQQSPKAPSSKDLKPRTPIARNHWNCVEG